MRVAEKADFFSTEGPAVFYPPLAAGGRDFRPTDGVPSDIAEQSQGMKGGQDYFPIYRR